MARQRRTGNCPDDGFAHERHRSDGWTRAGNTLASALVVAVVEGVMPVAQVRGVNINYEVLGGRGPWMALSPGGRRALDEIRYLAQPIADAGYRVILHDRRNCGASDVVIDGTDSEYEIWADDLYELLGQLNALPAIIGGSSSGCRLAILFALRHPEAVRALLLWRITGG